MYPFLLCHVQDLEVMTAENQGLSKGYCKLELQWWSKVPVRCHRVSKHSHGKRG